MIVDCHTHLNNYIEDKEVTLQESIDILEREMKRNRVDMALVLTSYTVNAARPSTKDVVEATRQRKHLSVIAGIPFHEVGDKLLGETREFLQDKLIKGFKIYPGYEPFYPNDPKLIPVYELAAEFEVPVMIHSGDTYAPQGKIKYSHPIHVDEIAVDHRGVNFVICHLGNPWFYDTMEIVYKNINVYTDISGLVLGNFSERFEEFMSKRVQDLILFGVESSKVLYGTDWPIAAMESYLEFVNMLRLPKEEKKKILADNTIKLFNLSPEHSLLGDQNGIWNLLKK
jgi:predicted TIM-barrel fold metal-dependent hydrolase